jgi:hypothetical protein
VPAQRERFGKALYAQGSAPPRGHRTRGDHRDTEAIVGLASAQRQIQSSGHGGGVGF